MIFKLNLNLIQETLMWNQRVIYKKNVSSHFITLLKISEK